MAFIQKITENDCQIAILDINKSLDELVKLSFKTDVSKLYFDKLLNNKNEIMESTDY